MRDRPNQGNQLAQASIDSSCQGTSVVVVVNYRTAELTKSCLSALKAEKAALPNLDVLVIDGGSGDGSAELLERTAAASGYSDWVSFLALPVNGDSGGRTTRQSPCCYNGGMRHSSFTC